MKALVDRSAFLVVLLLSLAAPPLAAQETGDDTQQLEAVEVIGSRIKRAGTEGQTPVQTLTREELEATGVTSIGDVLQRLSISASALNTKFNSAGNFGFASDGSGVGSGSTTISLRHLGAKRVLVLVDGVRWINESSASGVSAAVDLNTIPFSAIDHVEILTDGASALYGSDAIAGVVNVVTKKKQEVSSLRLYTGDYETGNGSTYTANLSLGGSAGAYDFFADISHYDQKQISSNEYEHARVPVPLTGVRFGSSGTPTTRTDFFDRNGDTHGGMCPLDDSDGDMVADTPLCDITADGTAAGPSFTHSFPAGADGGFHAFDGSATGDRFNFSPFNLLLTPSERTGLFTQVRRDIGMNMTGWLRVLYQSRESVNQAAPEPIFIGPDAGASAIANATGVDATNPFNPFGFALVPFVPGDATTNFVFAGRRPLEGGPRVFTQNVETRYLSAGVNGELDLMQKTFFWDLSLISGRNRAEQRVTGTYNIAHIARALGPLADCTAPCVPLNLFGGPGTITPAMLNYIQFTELDRSQQGIDGFSANISGELLPMPAGALEVATGVEHRRLSGSYAPDAIVIAGETNGVPSLPTTGSYSVDELYVETRVPLFGGAPAVKQLDLSLAARYSDYSTFGSTTNTKFGVLWQVNDQVTARATVAEGFRAPGVGELFGSPARFDATITDPCNLTPVGSQAEANCIALGVLSPSTFTQANQQISVATGGNPNLEPETADSTTMGVVYSPSWADRKSWAERMDFDFTYYDHSIEDSIQPIDAQTQLDRCVATLDPAFCNGIVRSGIGNISAFDNTLRNLGTVDTSGFDFGVDWVGPSSDFGRFGATWQSTYVDDYEAISKATGLAEPNGVGVEVNDSSIPRFRSNLRLKLTREAFEFGYGMRYISGLTEQCVGAVATFPVCSNPTSATTGTNELDATIYHDLRAQWRLPGQSGAKIAGGINNVAGEDPPICISCSLNGYDASLYDLPGSFGYLEASVEF